MRLFIIRLWRCSTRRPAEQSSFRSTRPTAASRTEPTAATADARSRCSHFVVLACALIIAVLAASCGGDDTSDGASLESAEESETVDRAAEDIADNFFDNREDARDADTAAADEDGEVDSDDDDEADITASTARRATPVPFFESRAFTSAYEAVRGAFTDYALLRNEGYFQALNNVDMGLETAAIRRAESIAEWEELLSAMETGAENYKRAASSDFRRYRDDATRTERSYRAEVGLILDAALEEARLDAEEEYILWEIEGEDAAAATEAMPSNCYYCDDNIGDIVGKTARRLAFDTSYLATLSAEILSMDSSPVRDALVAARDAAAAIAADNSLPYESANDALVGSIEAALAVSRNRSDFINNIERRINSAVDYSLNLGERGAEAAAAASLQEHLSRELSVIDQQESAELAGVIGQLAAETDGSAARIEAIEEDHRQAVARVAGNIKHARSKFEFARWSDSAFLLATTYLGLFSTAQQVESSLRDNLELGDPESMLALDHASALRSSLATVADAALFLINNYTPRTILDVEAEFADAAEALFQEAEKSENLLNVARSSAESRASALDL